MQCAVGSLCLGPTLATDGDFHFLAIKDCQGRPKLSQFTSRHPVGKSQSCFLFFPPTMLFQCAYCGRGFASEINLRRHEESALCQFSKDRKNGKLQCPNCPSKFATLHNLRRHQKRYHALEAVAAHACGFCPMRFQTLEDMCRHRNEQHERNLEDDGFILRDSAHARQSQHWRLVFPHDVDSMDRAFFYAW